MKKLTLGKREEIKWSLENGEWIARFQGEELERAVPDEKYAGMWRIRTPSGQLSDMVNLSRARDAISSKAVSAARRGRAAG